MSSVVENVKMPNSGARAPVKKKQPKDPNKAKEVYCILCRKMYWKHDGQDHMHSLAHHQELDTAVGNGAFHECHACEVSAMDLNEYGQHIMTTQHNANLDSLKSRNVKAVPLQRTLSTETISKVLERNKQLKNIEKKATKKKKKKQKQVAAHQQAGDQQTKAITAPTVSNLRKTQTAQARMLRQMQETQGSGTSTAVAQNKENRGSSLQRPIHHPGSFLQVESETLSDWPSEIWHQAYYQGLCTLPPPPQRAYSGKFAVNKQSNDTNTESTQTDGVQAFQGGATNKPEPISKPFVNYQYNTTQDKDFTDDQLPQSGAIIFGRSTPSPQPTQESSKGSARPVSSNKSANGAPLRDVDISSMLKHIRRVLGIREPCRAEREARKRSIDDITERTGPAHKQPVYVSSEDHVTSAPTTSSASAQLQQMSFKGTPEQSASEPTLYNYGKVRIAHKPGKGHLNTQSRLTPTQKELLRLSGGKNELNWTQMCKELRKKQTIGLRRFGLEMMKHPADQHSLTQSDDSDLPLSEGFQWESLPGSPHLSLLPQVQSMTGADDPADDESDYQIIEEAEQPASSQPSCSSRAGATVKMESSFGDEEFGDEEFGDDSHNKRKRNPATDDGISGDKSKKRKKKKSTRVSPNLVPGQDRMDQLLSVSLREEELSDTLQDLDNSLIQARNTLQAAYEEVQQIMLMKQQCAVEVNSLRAKRIEILQDMQEELSGLSNTPETATTSSGAVRPPSLASSYAVPSSSSEPASARTPASPFAQLEPAAAALSIKKEMGNLPTAQPPSRNADADPPPSVTLTGAAQQHTAECSPSPNTPAQTESSAGQEEQEIRKEEEDLVAELLLLAQCDSEEKIQENLSTDQAIAEIQLEESIDDKGNESDNSVEVIHSKTEIIAIEESDPEELAEATPEADDPKAEADEPKAEADEPKAEADDPQESVSEDLNSEGTQTAQKCNVDRKIELKPVKPDNDNTPGESAEGEEPSVGQFLNHTGPVNGLQIHDGLLYTCSGDNTARAYCLVTRECKAVFDGHTNKINCLLVSSLPNMPARLYTGASDQTIRAFSIKSKKCLEQISLPDRVLCLHIAWNILYVGLASGSVFSYDLKTLKELDVFECHGPRGVSCLGTAQEGARRLLLVGSYDSTISVRDAKSGLLLRSLEGHTKTVLCLKVVNDLIFSGSSDTSVHAHNIHTGELVRIYKGHGHAVTSIVILGKVMVTACLDKLVRVYELQSHDRLQVYGGHSDMVMCMAVHKSVIYTGCYDGSVQAVKLNLLKNYRCWWQNCSLIFGMAEHLAQHLTGDHSNSNLQMLKCRWRGCSSYFATQELIKEKLPEHMQKHVDDDGSMQS